MPNFDPLKLSWDDMHIVQTVKLHGSYARAARVLSLSETTIGRRIHRIEQSLGFALFDAVDGLRKPTAACLDIAEHLFAMQNAMQGITENLRSFDADCRHFRMTTIAFLAEAYIAPALPELIRAYPKLSLRIDVSDHLTDMSRWEVDFALRLGRPEAGNFLMRRVGALEFCLVRPRRPADAIKLVCYPEKLWHTPEMQALFAEDDLPDTRLETADIAFITRILLSGHGVGVVPKQVMLEHMTNPLLDITPLDTRREIWLLSQQHLKNDPLGRVLSNWCAATFKVGSGEL